MGNVSLALALMKGSPDYVADALRFAPVGNSVVGSLLSILHGVPRQYAEQAALQAARKLQRGQKGGAR